MVHSDMSPDPFYHVTPSVCAPGVALGCQGLTSDAGNVAPVGDKKIRERWDGGLERGAQVLFQELLLGSSEIQGPLTVMGPAECWTLYGSFVHPQVH